MTIIGKKPFNNNGTFNNTYTRETPVSEYDLQLKVEIDSEVYNKVMYWVNKSQFEVSGLGRIKYDAEAGVYRVIKAYLLPQKNTASTTEIPPEEVGKLMFETKDEEGTLNWWWHSHVKMGVFWSQTDLNAMEQLGRHGFFLSTVFNQNEEMLSALYQGAPFKIFANELPTEIVYPYDDSMEDEWDSEYSQKVTNVTYSYPAYNRFNTGVYNGYGTHTRYGMNGQVQSQTVFDALDGGVNDEDHYGVPDYQSPSQRQPGYLNKNDPWAYDDPDTPDPEEWMDEFDDEELEQMGIVAETTKPKKKPRKSTRKKSKKSNKAS